VERARIDRALSQSLAGVAALALLGWTFRDVRVQDVTALLGRTGYVGVVLVLLPQLFSAALETNGWRLVFLGRQVQFLTLLRVRIGSECVACLPAGVVLAESLKLPLLVRGLGLPVADAVCAIAARKYFLLLSQALYITLAALLGAAALEHASPAILGGGGLSATVLVAGFVVAIAGVGSRALLCRGKLATRFERVLSRVPLPVLRRALATHARTFAETDGTLQRFFDLHWTREVATVGWFLAGWIVEALETWIILRVLGVELDFLAVASFEVALSLVRSLVFVLPGGIGVQDAGYVLFLRALGVPDATTAGAAFSIVKRAKELAFAGLGLALLRTALGPMNRRERPRGIDGAREPIALAE